MRRLLLCSAALVLSLGAAVAQPEIGYWPGRFGADSRASPPPDGKPAGGTSARVDPCRAPGFTVSAGQALTLDIDSSGAFRQNTLASASPSDLGAFTLVGDTLRYTANDGVDAERDVVVIRSCTDDAGEDCQDREFVIGIGRAGVSRRDTIDLAGGADTTVALARPAGELFCGSVTPGSVYEYAAFRRVRFSEFVPGGRLRYRAARGSGNDEAFVVLCNGFGTCDTTEVLFRISGPRQKELPFFDDFSYPGPRPDPTRWLEDDVFVNDAYGRRAPSYGVATFDGVDGGGRGFGEGLTDVDQLTSAAMDLSDVSGDPVWVKYYVQVGGRGQAPEQTDRLITQFRRDDGAWVEQASLRGSRTSTSDSGFVFRALPVLGDTFRHADFQVRFLMRANAGGDFDNFNLDYVRVEQSPDSSASARDIALSARPPSPLAPYTRVPFSQFAGRAGELLRTRLPIEIWNHFPEVNNVSRTAVVAEDANGVELLRAGLLSGTQFNLPRGYSRFVNEVPSAPRDAYRAAADDLDADQTAALTLRYELGVDQDQLRLRGFLRNDSASTTVALADEFAYDDGTAESGIFNGRTGERTVVRYETAVADTLRGLRFAFPPLNTVDVRGQLINLQVFIGPLRNSDTLERAPDYQCVLQRPFFPSDAGDTLQAFTTYPLEDPSGAPVALPIPAGEFYVGWQQADQANNPVQVGLDLNNDNTDEIFTAFGEGWRPLSDFFPALEASLMVRPVFSAEPVRASSGTAELALLDLRAYPNPTTGAIQIETSVTGVTPVSYRVTDVTGRRVGGGAFAKTINLDVTPGLYVVEVLDGRSVRLGRVRVIVR